MGGDGGVIPKNRRYLRGAGAAEKTGNVSVVDATNDPKVLKEERSRAMKVCALSGKPLILKQTKIVVCPLGRLYNKESVVEALLMRKKKNKDARLDHIRGLKDLHDVRFHTIPKSSEDTQLVAACPIRGSELNGHIPAVVLVPGNPDTVNVVSERALKELGEEVILGEYGPAEEKIKLFPIGEELEEIKTRVMATVLAQKSSKKKDKKKRKRDDAAASPEAKAIQPTVPVPQTVDQPQSKVLQSLFTTKSQLSEKEKADNLFART